ncbi:hypothetical protein X975_07923, partial [Stegodyphus mimosarum]
MGGAISTSLQRIYLHVIFFIKIKLIQFTSENIFAFLPRATYIVKIIICILWVGKNCVIFIPCLLTMNLKGDKS